MTHYKNVELATKYNVSEATVRNWIKAAKQSKLRLALSEVGGRAYVANSPANTRLIEKLVEENKKYRNTRSAKTVSPRAKFYEVFTQAQIYDIVRNLEIHHEIQRQYNYFYEGADIWSDYTQHLADDANPNPLNQTIGLLSDNMYYLDKRLAKYKHINVVDIGPGNAYPVRELLSHLLELNVLGKYIALDVSERMLDIAEENIKQWFGDRVVFEGHQTDITHERFSDSLAEDYLKRNPKDSVNLILLLGSTPYNFRNPDDAFRVINNSMNPHDLLVYTHKLEAENTQPDWFRYTDQSGKLSISPRHRLVFDLLNIDESFYDVEMGFDPETHQKYLQARLKVALTLKFDFDDGERLVELEKGDTILLWRLWQMNAASVAAQFERTGYYTLHSSQTEDHEYILTVSEVKRG